MKFQFVIIICGYLCLSFSNLQKITNRARVNALNSGSVLNFGNRPQSGSSIFSGVAHQCVMGPKAAKWPLIVQSDIFPVFSTLPELSGFTLIMLSDAPE